MTDRNAHKNPIGFNAFSPGGLFSVGLTRAFPAQKRRNPNPNDIDPRGTLRRIRCAIDDSGKRAEEKNNLLYLFIFFQCIKTEPNRVLYRVFRSYGFSADRDKHTHARARTFRHKEIH